MDRYARAMRNALTSTSIKTIAENRDILTGHNDKFSHRIKTKGISNQKSSGRCWMFAGFNVMKPVILQKLDLDEFEFSQIYLQFWDKMEKANKFLEYMIEYRERDLLDREVVFFLQSPSGRKLVSRLSLRVPVFGRIVCNVILARVCRIWGQLLDSKVDVLDAVHLAKQGTSSLDFREMFDQLEAALTEGNPIGPTLRNSWLFPKTFAAAVATGEESGKLSIALLFVAGCLEEENMQVLGALTRIIEPIILVGMGLVVGTVAVSLFLPMFDMATVAHH